MSPLLAQDAIIRVTLQRQISVDVRDQKVLKTIVCGEGYIRRVDLDAQGREYADQENGREHGSGVCDVGSDAGEEDGRGQDFGEGNGEAGWFGTIAEEDDDDAEDMDHHHSTAFDPPEHLYQHAHQQSLQTVAASLPSEGRTRDVQIGGSSDGNRNMPRETNVQDDWAGWEGEVVPSLKQISVGGFRTAGLAVRVSLIPSLIAIR